MYELWFVKFYNAYLIILVSNTAFYFSGDDYVTAQDSEVNLKLHFYECLSEIAVVYPALVVWEEQDSSSSRIYNLNNKVPKIKLASAYDKSWL